MIRGSCSQPGTVRDAVNIERMTPIAARTFLPEPGLGTASASI